MKYQIVTARKPETLAEEVNRKLSLGWELYGSPFSDPDEGLCQAMIFKSE